VNTELDFTDSHKWSADGWCFTHSTEAGPVYCRRPPPVQIDPPWNYDQTDLDDLARDGDLYQEPQS